MLVTGANGFVGRNLCDYLSRQGWNVRAAVRTGVTTSEPDRVVVGEIGGSTDWQEALHAVDAVVHCAARVHVLDETEPNPFEVFRRINVTGTENLARQAVTAGVRHFIFLSSIGARIAENDGLATPYQQSKLEGEKVLTGIATESETAFTFLRPPLIYGPDAPGNFALLVKAIQRGVPLPLASIKNGRAFLYIGNLCDAIQRCLDRPDQSQRCLEVADGPSISTPDLIRELAAVLGQPARLWPCPVWLLSLAGKMTGRSATIERLTGSLELSTSAMMEELDWSPPWDLRAGLTASFNSGISAGEN